VRRGAGRRGRGGNSAGQAALFLAQACTSVRIVIRGASLTHSMSRYLIDQIDRQPLISVVTRSEVVGLLGDKVLTGVEVADNRSGSLSTSRSAGCLSSSGQAEHRVAREQLAPTRTASSSPARTSRRPHPSQPGMHRCCSRPAGRASSAWATCGAGRSSGWRRPSGGIDGGAPRVRPPPGDRPRRRRRPARRARASGP